MKRNRNKVLIVVIVIFAAILLGAGGYFVYKTLNINGTQDEYNTIASSFASFDEPSTAEPYEAATAQGDASTSQSTTTKPKKVDNPVNLADLSAQNPDVYAWINVPGTNVNYPVLQSDYDDNFYLDHDVYKNYSFPGAIYSQSCNKKDWSDRVTLLYGHNMRNGSMFATLHNFSNTEFFNSHPYFYIYTKDRKLTYEIVSAFVYDSRHIMNSFDFSNDKVFQEWLDNAKQPRSTSYNARSDVELTTEDSKMVVLSTCLNSGDGRYLVQGVLISDEQTN